MWTLGHAQNLKAFLLTETGQAMLALLEYSEALENELACREEVNGSRDFPAGKARGRKMVREELLANARYQGESEKEEVTDNDLEAMIRRRIAITQQQGII